MNTTIEIPSPKIGARKKTKEEINKKKVTANLVTCMRQIHLSTTPIISKQYFKQHELAFQLYEAKKAITSFRYDVTFLYNFQAYAKLQWRRQDLGEEGSRKKIS